MDFFVNEIKGRHSGQPLGGRPVGQVLGDCPGDFENGIRFLIFF
jgi:hypothetical protein